VLAQQKAVLLGAISDYRASPLDRGYTLKSAVDHLRSVMRAPLLSGFPFGHVRTKVTVPLGVRVELAVQGRDALLGW
jgi:muramoyltetrapeptide carboxypeptidase